MPRNADGLYVYPISILSISRGPAWITIFDLNRYVVFGMYRRRALPRATAISGNERVQSDRKNHRDVRVSRLVLAKAWS